MINVLIDLVVSLNGMIARENGDEDWLPEDGWESFLHQIDTHQNVIIGRETYELVKAKYEHDNFDAITTTLKIIVSTRKNYEAPNAGYVVAHSPEEAVELVRKAGLQTAYVGGGGKLCAAFLNARLVSALRLTVIPYIIPSGRPFVSTLLHDDVSLDLVHSKQEPDGALINLYHIHT